MKTLLVVLVVLFVVFAGLVVSPLDATLFVGVAVFGGLLGLSAVKS